MHFPTQELSEDQLAQADVLRARQVSWRTSAAMLIALVALNAGLVILTRSQFGATFALANGINLILAWGLFQTKSWARILAIVWETLGIGLAVAVAVQSGATGDLLVTLLLQGGILLPLAGPPHKAKNVVGILMFVAGLSMTALALMSQLVIAR